MTSLVHNNYSKLENANNKFEIIIALHILLIGEINLLTLSPARQSSFKITILALQRFMPYTSVNEIIWSIINNYEFSDVIQFYSFTCMFSDLKKREDPEKKAGTITNSKDWSSTFAQWAWNSWNSWNSS